MSDVAVTLQSEIDDFAPRPETARAAIEEIKSLRSRLDECRESCARAVAARDVATSRLGEAFELLNDAVAEIDGHVDVARAALWLAANDRFAEAAPKPICPHCEQRHAFGATCPTVVEKVVPIGPHEHRYDSHGYCECGIHALD